MSRTKHEHYILDDEKQPIPVDMMTWARAFEDVRNRIVSKTQIGNSCEVSTVFLGLDHRYFGDGPPLLFETLVFGGPLKDEMVRYSSWDDAVTGHAAMVRRVNAAIEEADKKT